MGRWGTAKGVSGRWGWGEGAKCQKLGGLGSLRCRDQEKGTQRERTEKSPQGTRELGWGGVGAKTTIQPPPSLRPRGQLSLP